MTINFVSALFNISFKTNLPAASGMTPDILTLFAKDSCVFSNTNKWSSIKN